jgi:ureidoglycolate hydrolase
MKVIGTSIGYIPGALLEVGMSFEQKYRPVLDFHGWRVAMLRYFDAVAPETFHRVERHRETNEVFILTAGQADLIVFAGDAQPTTPHVFPMELHIAYNIRQAVWHHVAMSPDAHIVLFERTDTTLENSDYAELPPELIQQIKANFTVQGRQ